jgi:hypothetical protein
MSLTSMDVEPDGKNPKIPGKKTLTYNSENCVLSISIEFTQSDLQSGLEVSEGEPSPFADWLKRMGLSWERLDSGLIKLDLVWKEGELRDPINHLSVIWTPVNEELSPWKMEMHVLLAPDAGIASIPNREAMYFTLGIILLAWPDRSHREGYWNVSIEPLGPFARWRDGQQGVSGMHGILHTHVPPNLRELRLVTREWS